MRALQRDDVIGRRIVDVIVSVPDKPVTMSTMSYSPGYLRLDSGILFYLGQPTAPELHASDEAALTSVMRDAKSSSRGVCLAGAGGLGAATGGLGREAGA